MENNQYLGREKVGKLLGKFAIPCIFSLIISCLYNIVDQIFVGNGIGYLGNAATGVIFPITVVGWGMSLFFGDGAAAHLSVALGRNEATTRHCLCQRWGWVLPWQCMPALSAAAHCTERYPQEAYPSKLSDLLPVRSGDRSWTPFSFPLRTMRHKRSVRR